jgi:hypothetical protein
MDIDRDLVPFGTMLDAVCGLLSRGSYQPNEVSTAIFFRALQPYTFEQVRQAFDAHVRDPERGRFVPTPADILAQLHGRAANDGRPGPEEAWSIAIRGMDEAATVVWTDEICAAWAIARPVMQIGDEVGARMAFKEAYTRIVGEARGKGEPMAWVTSLGHDPEQRSAAVREAVIAGRLPKYAVDALLPAPREAVPLLEGPEPVGTKAHHLERLRTLRELLRRQRSARRQGNGDAARTAALKRQTLRQIEEYERGVS